jgi:Protein of unknown function (DUF2442)
MTHAIHRVISFEIVGPHTIVVAFADGVTQAIDFLPVLRGELYGPLREPSYFSLVTLDPDVHTLVWPNGADFDPATLHDWPAVADEFIALAKGWDDRGSSKAD